MLRGVGLCVSDKPTTHVRANVHASDNKDARLSLPNSHIPISPLSPALPVPATGFARTPS